jgi:hypothetical protein
MRTQTFILLGLAAVGSAACSRTTLDTAATVDTATVDTVATGSNACGDKVLDGYLVDAWTCPNSFSASLPDFASKDGRGCLLDVYLSQQVPAAAAVPEACNGEPFTSKCLLETAGFTGFGVDFTGVAVYPRASLVGSMQTTSVCTLIAKCAPMRPECEECKQQTIFVPCQLTVE